MSEDPGMTGQMLNIGDGRPEIDKVFSGSIPGLYESHLVPVFFESYAQDLAERVASHGPHRILEIAAGTGVMTRALARALPSGTAIVASDLNEPMLYHARGLGTVRPVEWRQADATQLPFEDESFDEVVCQFGVMFFPEKAKAYSEVQRVLRPGGFFTFSVWDRLEENDFAAVITKSLELVFPANPPRFLPRTPYGYYEHRAIEQDLAGGRFTASPRFVTVAARSRAESARIPAVGFCQGTPLRNEIEALAPSRLAEATDAAAESIARQFGRQSIDGRMQAHIVTVVK